jgi:hypothetical protein
MTSKHVLESFVARIWLEPGANGDSTWHGHVRHVQGEQETYFQGMTELSDFLELVSGVSGPRQTGQSARKVRGRKPGP